jgi:hypothetical protein
MAGTHGGRVLLAVLTVTLLLAVTGASAHSGSGTSYCGGDAPVVSHCSQGHTGIATNHGCAPGSNFTGRITSTVVDASLSGGAGVSTVTCIVFLGSILASRRVGQGFGPPGSFVHGCTANGIGSWQCFVTHT